MTIILHGWKAPGQSAPAPASRPSSGVALFGDSNSAIALYGSLHPMTWIIGLNGGVLQLVANSSRAGRTVDEGLAEIGNLYTDSVPGLAGLGSLGLAVIALGTNGTRTGTPITAPLQASYVALFTAALALAEYVAVMSVPPIGSPESGDGVPSYNAWLSAYCESHPRMVYIDTTSTVDDGTGDWASGYAPGDGVHLSDAGSYQMGFDGATSLAPWLAQWAWDSPLVTDPAIVYPGHPQWVKNTTMAGTGGSGTGTVPTDWAVAHTAGGTQTSSKVSAAVDDPNQTPWLRVTPLSIADGGAEGGLVVTPTLAHPAITDSSPDTIEAMFEIRFNNFASQRFRRLQFYVYGNGNEALTPPAYLRMQQGPTTALVVARCAIRRSATRVSSSVATFALVFSSLESFTGDMGSFDVRCATVKVIA